MSKPCVMWESSVETYCAIGWCLSNHAKVSGRKCDGVLVTEGQAAPFGVLSPAVSAGMEVRAAGAAKTAPLVITWLLMAPCGGSKWGCTCGGQRSHVLTFGADSQAGTQWAVLWARGIEVRRTAANVTC